MKLLLDTQVYLWWILDDRRRLNAETRKLIASPGNQVYVSAASIWEIAIKRSIGKIDCAVNVADEIEKNDFRALSITVEHAHAAGNLPPHHRDPFDRMLVAQSLAEGLKLVTADFILRDYKIALHFCG
jgi:PIN domain nuclease of toxin-antitoxin system